MTSHSHLKSAALSALVLTLSACGKSDCGQDNVRSEKKQIVDLYALPQIEDGIEQVGFYDAVGGRMLDVYVSQTALHQLRRRLPILDDEQLRRPKWLKVTGYAPVIDECRFYRGNSVLLLDSVKSLELVNTPEE